MIIVIRWYKNHGDFKFTAHLIFDNAKAAHSVDLKDVDNDGDIDIVAGSGVDSSIRLFSNNGQGEFTSKKIFANASGVQSVFFEDMNADGLMDILSASYHDDAVRVFTQYSIDICRFDWINSIKSVFSLFEHPQWQFSGFLDTCTSRQRNKKTPTRNRYCYRNPGCENSP